MTDVVEFARDVLGVELLPYQEAFLRQMEDGELKIRVQRRPGRVTLERVWDEYMQFKKLRLSGETANE